MDNNGYDDGGNENPETNPENIEMKDMGDKDWHNLSMELDSMGFGKDEEDTSFVEKSDRLLDNDEVLEMNDSNNLFVEGPSTSAFDPNAIPNVNRDVGVIKRSIIADKKQFIFKVFGIKVNKGSGKFSTTLYDELKTTTGEKSGKINGATYKGKKILILMKNGKMEYSKNKDYQQLVFEFKNLLDKAKAEHNTTPASIVENQITHEISEETVNNIRENAANDMDVASTMAFQTINLDFLTTQEVREVRGVMNTNWVTLMGEGGENLVREKIRAIIIEKENLKRNKFESGLKKERVKEEGYAKLINAIELKIDAGRLKINEKPQSSQGQEILNKESEINEFSKLDKFKKWAKENMLGLSAIAITIAGIIVSIVAATRNVVKAGAGALSGFAKAVVDIAKKFGPIIGAVASAIMSALMFGAQGLLWLAQNLWVLAIALTYFLYNEYKKK